MVFRHFSFDATKASINASVSAFNGVVDPFNSYIEVFKVVSLCNYIVKMGSLSDSFTCFNF